ncbi:MAG TPA: hypothetical protein PK948_09320 [Gemmatimonadales bacterium]|jgi:hypothetical protein|nr:hypothetical protein [Gemmatimonadales bacterium]
MSLFIAYPALALVPALLFLLGYWWSRRPSNGIAALCWLLYAGYETAMRLRWLCTGECNIRVDLLLLYPALAAVSLFAAVAFARARRGSPP